MGWEFAILNSESVRSSQFNRLKRIQFGRNPRINEFGLLIEFELIELFAD